MTDREQRMSNHREGEWTAELVRVSDPAEIAELLNRRRLALIRLSGDVETWKSLSRQWAARARKAEAKLTAIEEQVRTVDEGWQ